MIDIDLRLPQARERLLMLCGLLGQASRPDEIAALTAQIERTALDIGFIYAVALVRPGLRSDDRIEAEIDAQRAAAAAPCTSPAPSAPAAAAVLAA